MNHVGHPIIIITAIMNMRGGDEFVVVELCSVICIVHCVDWLAESIGI